MNDVFENPLDGKQIRLLNQMFGNVQDYEKNMLQLWTLRKFIGDELEKRGGVHPGLKDSFYTINHLIGALLPNNGRYCPEDGLRLYEDGGTVLTNKSYSK